EVLREARVAGCLRPIILLTGQGDGEVDIAAMKAGAADYLVKGQIDSQILERSIRYSLEHNRTLEALRESEERYALSARGANDGLWVWDLGAGTVYYSDRWKEMLGFSKDEIGDTPEEWFSRVHPDDVAMLRADIDAHRHGTPPRRSSVRGPLHRPRSLQSRQRQPWPRARRHAPHQRRRTAARRVASDRHGRAARRRRVHDPSRNQSPRRRRAHGRAHSGRAA